MTVTPTKPAVGPGDEVEFEVTTADQLGRPVAAEVSVALVDRSLLRQFADNLPPIGPFFYDQTRTGAFSTDSTNTFTYQPTTTGVAQGGRRGGREAAAVAGNARAPRGDHGAGQSQVVVEPALQCSFTARSR